MKDTVRVLRVIEYTGDREAVEFIVNNSIQTVKEVNYNNMSCSGKVTIRVGTIGNFPEILEGKHEES